MERLEFELPSARPAGRHRRPAVVGVVASGNLEVLVEAAELPDRCRVSISTSAQGFGDVWRAVVEDFAARRPVGGLAFAVNDAGATPAVVMLRLEQAAEEFLEEAS